MGPLRKPEFHVFRCWAARYNNLAHCNLETLWLNIWLNFSSVFDSASKLPDDKSGDQMAGLWEQGDLISEWAQCCILLANTTSRPEYLSEGTPPDQWHQRWLPLSPTCWWLNLCNLADFVFFFKFQLEDKAAFVIKVQEKMFHGCFATLQSVQALLVALIKRQWSYSVQRFLVWSTPMLCFTHFPTRCSSRMTKYSPVVLAS